jgi:hypothetical protein
MRKQRALLAGLLAIFLSSAAGSAWASPLLTLQIEGSYTGAPGTYGSGLGNVLPGQTIYYEVNAVFNNGATNSNTANVPNGTSDSIDSLPAFQLTVGSGWTLTNATMQNGFGAGTGAGVTQPNGANTAVIRAVNSPGVYMNADSPLTIETGQLMPGTTSGIPRLLGAYYANSGLTKVSGNLTSITSTTESSADPIVSYTPLETGLLPEPTSLAVFGLGALGLLRRRRQSA